jgi:hypothetical protein
MRKHLGNLKDLIKMTKKILKKPTFMRIPKEVLQELKGCKIARRESYADVVKRLIEKERKLKGGKY